MSLRRNDQPILELRFLGTLCIAANILSVKADNLIMDILIQRRLIRSEDKHNFYTFASERIFD